MLEAARILYGSQNYHLDGPDSDKDYKILLTPEFEDFYNYHKADKQDLPRKYNEENNSVMSVITFDANLRHGNINALELLFSREQVFYADMFDYFDTAKELFANGYLGFVWPEFYRTMRGMIMNSLDRYGVTRKTASRVNFLTTFAYYIMRHDFKVTEKSWDDYCVYGFARRIRFEEDMPLPTYEELTSNVDWTGEATLSCVTDWVTQQSAPIDGNILLHKMRKFVYNTMEENY